ncbi:MAG: hypothetical protein ACXWN2_10335 [Candidatus Limnocylindrales bacterium]
MDVPGFLAKQFYVAKSLRNTATGFRLEAQNPMGNGTLVGIGRLAVDGQTIEASAVSALRADDPTPIQAASVDKFHPIRVQKGDHVALLVAGAPLSPGEHRLEVELYEVNLGLLRLAITDTVAPA